MVDELMIACRSAAAELRRSRGRKRETVEAVAERIFKKVGPAASLLTLELLERACANVQVRTEKTVLERNRLRAALAMLVAQVEASGAKDAGGVPVKDYCAVRDARQLLEEIPFYEPGVNCPAETKAQRG